MQDYQPKFWLRNGHIQSMLPSTFRKVTGVNFIRERISTPDDDFLDIDWLKTGQKKLVIITHGLEGNSRRPYVLGLAKALHQVGYDVLAWNFRGCSGTMNRQFRMYHNGAIDDLEVVIQKAISVGYGHIVLSGFSMGANMTLLYLGKKASHLYLQIKGALTFSAVMDLTDCALTLEKKTNFIYMKYFLRTLRKKVLAKQAQYPDKINAQDLHRVHTFSDFDDRYTAPMHGFKNARDYWKQCSSLPYLKNISVPTLILNAQNDPFLGKNCYPQATQLSDAIEYEYPKHGGHVGFMQTGVNGLYYSEQRALEFVQAHFA